MSLGNSFICVKNAEKGGYAVGAFNVYNLEGVEAVVAAAEEEQSPAILQVKSNGSVEHTYFVIIFLSCAHKYEFKT